MDEPGRNPRWVITRVTAMRCDVRMGDPARDMVGYGADPPAIEWPDGAAMALSIVVNYEEGSEYGREFGDPRADGMTEVVYAMPDGIPDFAAESMYEYGSRVGIWRLFRLLSEYRVKCTVFAAALAIERNLEVGEWIAAHGLEPCGHGWRWEDVWRLSEADERRHLQDMVSSLTRTCGRRPVGCYHRYAPSRFTRQLIVDEGGFLYDSDSYADDLPYYVVVAGKRHLIVPYSLTYNDSKYVLGAGIGTPSAFVDIVRRGIDEYRREGHAGRPKMMSLGLHPRVSGHAGRTSGVREVIEYCLEVGDVWIATREEIARWVLAHSVEWGIVQG